MFAPSEPTGIPEFSVHASGNSNHNFRTSDYKVFFVDCNSNKMSELGTMDHMEPQALIGLTTGGAGGLGVRGAQRSGE